MLRGWVLVLLATLAAVLATAVPVPAYASRVPVAAECRASGDAGESWRRVVADASRWRCGGERSGIGPDVTLVRFALDRSGVRPLSFVAHYGRFDRVTLIALDRDGSARARDYTMNDVHRISAGPFFSAPLPPIGPSTVAVIARIERPWIELTLNHLWLDDAPGGSGWPIAMVTVLAMVCGILLVPLLLNAAFYWAMPQRYVVWHLLMVSSTLVQAATLTGLIPLLLPLPFAWQIAASDISFAALTAGALMFMRDWIEPTMLGPRLRQAMLAQAICGVILSSLISLSLPMTRPFAIGLLHLTVLPAIVLLFAAMAVAWRNGSRLVLFQIVGWSPALAVGLMRIGSFLLAGSPSEAPLAYHVALAFEVLVTAVGIISRFANLRRERDRALNRSVRLEDEAGIDPLTGLNNRRGIEERFDELRRAGFDTLAVIDLDHFKQINDACGHSVGDKVLAATGLALREDADLCTWRIGGEEFLLLLRGRNALARAESCRQAIPSRIAALVPGLPNPVTASMGVVELPRGAMLATRYAELYAQADRLLYEAKRNGRNRTVSERLKTFTERRGRERPAKTQAA
jgi:diguanylate cyclase (GGDEF)-like protein